jgi:hypothetical protein
VLTGALIIGFPITNFVYWPVVLRAGVLPPEGDTIIIPMMGSVFSAAVASPFVLGAAWLCLRRYNPATRLLAWRRERLVLSIVATVVLGGAAAFLVGQIFADVVEGVPWYDAIWHAYAIVCIAWLLGLRAAAVEQLEPGPASPER